MKFYTPVSHNDNARGLMGRILIIKKTPTGHALFIDAQTGKPLWETTTIKNIEYNDTGVVFSTSSGSVYNLVAVDTLLPTKLCEEKEPKEEKKVDDTTILTAIDMKEEYKDIHYCDGYYKVTYTFNQNITLDRFIEFIKNRHFHNPRINVNFPKNKADADWYEDYDIIEGSDNIWTWTWVKRYTD